MNATSGVITLCWWLSSMQVNLTCIWDYAGQLDLHTGQPLTQTDYTRSCINTIVLLRMSTELLETCRGLK
jgi:hypothetical protein